MKRGKKCIRAVMLIGLILIIGCEKEQPAEPETYPNWQDYWTLLYESQSLYQITFVSDDEAWITAGHDMIHYQYGKFTRIALPEPIEKPDVWGLQRCSFYDANHGLAVGSGNWPSTDLIYKYDNGTWNQIHQIENPSESQNYYDVRALSVDDIWVCGSYIHGACVWHWDGSCWQRYDLSDATAERLYFISPNDGYVSSTFSVFHWNGSEWQCVQQFWDRPYDIVRDNQGNNFVGMFELYNLYGIYQEYPMMWRSVPSSYCSCIYAMAGNSQGEIWAGGYSILLPGYDVLANWNGEHWTYYKSQPCWAPYVYSLFVKENGEVWAVIATFSKCYVAKLNKENLPVGGN